MEDGYLFSAAKCIVAMQPLQAAAEVVFQRTGERSNYLSLASALLAEVGLLLTVACVLTNICSQKIKMEGRMLYFDGLYLLFHRSWF